MKLPQHSTTEIAALLLCTLGLATSLTGWLPGMLVLLFGLVTLLSHLEESPPREATEVVVEADEPSTIVEVELEAGEEAPPGWRMRLSEDIGGATVSVPTSLSPLAAGALVSLMAAAQLYHFVAPAPYGQLWLGLALVPVQLLIIAVARHRQKITLSAQTLRIETQPMFSPATTEEILPLAHIQSCKRVERARWSELLMAEPLQGLVVTDQDWVDHQIGWGLAREELAWLEKTINGAIAQRAPTAQHGSEREIPAALAELVQR